MLKVQAASYDHGPTCIVSGVDFTSRDLPSAADGRNAVESFLGNCYTVSQSQRALGGFWSKWPGLRFSDPRNYS